LLETLLEYHAGQGGSAIVLTATLAQSMRAALTAAWQRGCQAPKEIPEQEAFPLFTAVSPQGVLAEQPLSSPKAAERSVAIEWLADEETAIETILAAANRGEAVAWVRNTVDDAIRAYEAIREQLSEPDCCMLFHARFAMVDRQRIEQAVLARFGK